MGRGRRQDGASGGSPERVPFGEPATAGSPPKGSHIVGWGEVATGDFRDPQTEPIGTSILFVDSETGKLMEVDVSIEIDFSKSDNLEERDTDYEEAVVVDELRESLLQSARQAVENGESIDRIQAPFVRQEADFVTGTTPDRLDQTWGRGDIEGGAALFIEYEFEDSPVREVENPEAVLQGMGTPESQEALRLLGQEVA